MFLRTLQRRRNRRSKNFALIADEIRREVIHTLGPDGDELDQRVERANLADAGIAYRRSLKDGWSGRCDAIGGENSVTRSREYQKRVSVFRHVENVRLSEIQSADTKQMVTYTILDFRVARYQRRSV